MTESIINRARVLLGMGLGQKEAAVTLTEGEVSPMLAYLAVKAASLIDR